MLKTNILKKIFIISSLLITPTFSAEEEKDEILDEKSISSMTALPNDEIAVQIDDPDFTEAENHESMDVMNSPFSTERLNTQIHKNAQEQLLSIIDTMIKDKDIIGERSIKEKDGKWVDWGHARTLFFETKYESVLTEYVTQMTELASNLSFTSASKKIEFLKERSEEFNRMINVNYEAVNNVYRNPLKLTDQKYIHDYEKYREGRHDYLKEKCYMHLFFKLFQEEVLSPTYEEFSKTNPEKYKIIRNEYSKN